MGGREGQTNFGVHNKKCDERYEVGLLWKNDVVNLPDSYGMAMSRLRGLEKKVAKDPDQLSLYDDVICEYIQKGFARKVSRGELEVANPKRWFLPHHAVQQPNKLRPRIVFDASAICEGKSLNTELLTGPDLLRNLCGILLRFREENVALSADVEKMYHQIRLRAEDQVAQSFLWRNGDTSRIPDVFQMKVVIFGAKCSPAIANYVLHRLADDSAGNISDRTAASALKTNFYMDDFLRSESTVSSAANIQKKVSSITARGGFHLRKWVSNEREAIAGVSEQDKANTGENHHRVLGCLWKTDSDVLLVDGRSGDMRATKRDILRRSAMVFDPLGLP